MTVLETGGLQVILRLCCNTSDTVAVMSVSTLSMLVEDLSTHAAIIDGDKAALQRMLKLAAAESPQVIYSVYYFSQIINNKSVLTYKFYRSLI